MEKLIKHLTQSDLANRWNKSVHTIERYRMEGVGPIYLKIGGKVMYRVKDIEKFEEERLFSNPKMMVSVTESANGMTLGEALSRK
jgi:hypothetical protein